MTVGTFDRKTLAFLVIGLAVIAVLRFGVYGDKDAEVVAPAESIPKAEQRLQRVRQLAAMLPGKEAVLKQASAELAAREKGLLIADTYQQAQAQLLSLIQQVATANGFSAAGAEGLNVKPLAKDYGEVSVSVAFTCGVDQLVNFMAAIANEPQVLSTNEINITGGNDKKKNVQVRLTLSGVVPKTLLPAKKAGGAF
jgi:Tfp pilus assembly protein PilO